MDTIQETKKCGNCNEVKPANPEYFHRDKSRKDGLNPVCKICVKKYQQANHSKMIGAAYRWRNNNPEKQRNAVKTWAKKNKEKRIAYSKKYRISNPEKSKASSQNWKDRNRERTRQYARQWAKDNREKDVARVQRRRARINGTQGAYTKEEWDNLCEKYNYKCLACGEAKPLTVDHIIPLTKGGLNDISNIQPLCAKCNLAKRTKTIDYRY